MRIPVKLTGGRAILRRMLRWIAEESGNIGPVLAIMVVPIIGAFAVAGESSSWYAYHRSQQNAADSAAIAAAVKGATAEGTTVATSYGYTTGTNNVTVTPSTPSCPSGAISGTTCYQVQIDRKVPIYLSRVVGFTGETTIGTQRAKFIQAKAIAGLTSGNTNFCMIGLNSIKLGGGNGTNLTGCALLSGSGGMQCSGANSAQGVTNAYTAGSFQGNAGNCAPNPHPGYTAFSGDPELSTVNSNLSSLAGCSFTAPAGGTISSLTGGANNCFSPTTQLTLSQNITVTTPNTVLAIKTTAGGVGGLNLNGHTLSTSGSGTLTIVFTGTTQINSPIMPSNGGTLNIAAPGADCGCTWKGYAIVEDPAMPNASHQGQTFFLDMSFAGGSNAITLDLSGLIYLPHATFNINGAIDHASNGFRCIDIVANTINATGTNSIFANPTSECRQQGTVTPTVPMVALLQ